MILNNYERPSIIGKSLFGRSFKNVATLEIHPYPSSHLMSPNRADGSLHICLHFPTNSTPLLAPLLHSSSQTKNIAKAFSSYALPSFTKSTVHMREGVKKKLFFGTLSQTMGTWGSKVPNFLAKITIQLFLLIFRTLS